MRLGLVVLAVALLGVGAAGTDPSGLRGTVTRSPTRPVCVVGEPCSAPAPNVAIQFVRPGHRTVTTRTDTRGRYRVTLAPGVWSVRTAPTTRIARAIEPKNVRVYAGRFRVVDFDIDTGIR